MPEDLAGGGGQSPSSERPRRLRSTAWREVLTRDTYLQLKAQGRTDKSIRLEYGVQSDATWNRWKREQGLIPLPTLPSGQSEAAPTAAAPGPDAPSVGEVIDLIQELRRDVECCAEVLAERDATNNVAAMLTRYRDECESRLREIESAKVVL